ncbi:protein kinase domain-containing protein [Rufibacter radiotolerans]|uniref:protein kinase domain-containing protein n=1 Tax=Rufibacter radiotolerans TaxID=1379910 RepID=UPI0006646BEB|nr:hypothetical protein [Rufibacter radiotolerans]
MANKQEILTAIKNLDVFLKIPELKGAEVRLNPNGRPFAITGGFNMVFQLTHNSKKWAFRVWHVSMGETKERYQAISKYLAEKKLRYFADFIFEEKGILVNGDLLDTVRMEWLEGVLLKEYLEQNLHNRAALETLAANFILLFHDLHINQISHGDLQEGNILINANGDIRLIDYDSVCVPAIEGEKDLVTGLKGYQHPSRFKQSRASLKADYFSELVIYLSILAISENPALWGKYQVKDSCYLLFSETDFENLKASAIFNDLKGLSTKIDKLLAILINFIKTKDYTNLSTFTSYLLPPKINEFLADKEVILQGGEVVLAWETENTLEVRISNVQASFTSSGHYLLKPKSSEEYCLKAVGFFESQEQKIKIKVFPTPEIRDFSSSFSKIKPGKVTTLRWSCSNCERIELYDGTYSYDVTNKTSLDVNPTITQLYKLRVTGYASLQVKEAVLNVQVLPDTKIDEFTASKLITIQTVPTILRWKVRNGAQLILNPGEIDITGTSNLEVCPSTSSTYELIVRHELHESRRTLRIDVTPLPRIENLRLPHAPQLKLNPPNKVWPLLPELLSGEIPVNEQDEIFVNQVLPGRFPYSGSISRFLTQLFPHLEKAKSTLLYKTIFYIKNFLAVIAGVDGETFKHAEAGRKSWDSIGLNVLIAGVMAGASMASLIVLLGFKYLLLWLWLGLITMFSIMVLWRLGLRFLVPNLNKPIFYTGLIFFLITLSFVISAPMEAILLTVADPEYRLEVTPILEQLIHWVLLKNGEYALIVLRGALRVCSFIILGLPFYMAWSVRKGTYAYLKNSRADLEIIMTTK